MNRRGFLGLLAGAALGVASGMGLRSLSSDALDSIDFEQVYVPDFDTARLYPDASEFFAEFKRIRDEKMRVILADIERRYERALIHEGPWSFSRVGDPIEWDHA